MWGEAASEILRVIKKGGEIHLLHPEEQKHLHDQIISLSNPSHSQSSLVFMDYEGFAIRFIRTIIQI